MGRRVTYKDIYTLTVEEIEKRMRYPSPRYGEQLSRPFFVNAESAASGASAGEIISAIQAILEAALPPFIIEGLTVEATDPVSTSVIIRAGKGSVGGKVYELEEDLTLEIPLNSYTFTFFINLHLDHISVDTSSFDNKLTIAKIIVPLPGTSARIVDRRDESTYDAYIMNYTEYKLYGDGYGRFEENTIEMLRDNIGDILADSIIGELKLSEKLTITNTQGTLVLDSSSLNLYDFDENLLGKFNKDGIFFYNAAGTELARFTTDDARIGNILITHNSIESADFSSGLSGFQIKDDGNVEFNDGTFRGTLNANAGVIGGWTITDTMLYGTTTGIIQTGANVGLGQDGVVLDIDGLRGYNATLGLVFDLPTDGSAPTFSSGIINQTVFNINTSSILRTSEMVGIARTATAHYTMNDNASNTTVADSEGSYDGTASQNTEDMTTASDSGITAKINDALIFNGSSDYIDCGATDFIGSGDINFTTWIYPEAWGGYLLDNGAFQVYINSERVYVSSDAGVNWASSGEDLELDSWQNISINRDSDGLVNIYVNNVRSGDPDQDSGTPTAGTNNIYLGCENGSSNWYEGRLDDTRFYNDTITTEEISWIYNSGNGRETALGGVAGILINSTGMYGCGDNQLLANANLKVLANGNIYLEGEIVSQSGNIGGVTIGADTLTGGLLIGCTVRGGTIETSANMPRTRIDENGIYYQVTGDIGKYGGGGSGMLGFKYGDGTKYGLGVLAYIFNENYPLFAVTAEHDYADIRLYNRSDVPESGEGSHVIGDIICADDRPQFCTEAGSPGTFNKFILAGVGAEGLVFENRTDDPTSPVSGQVWFRTDV